MTESMIPDPQVVADGPDGETRTSLPELEEVAYDPTRATLDLTKEEKRRTTALMLAIQGYQHLIVKDPQMYTAMVAGGKQLHPATIHGMVEAAVQFDLFISGRLEAYARRMAEAATNPPEDTKGE